jgi:hypothetical protein
VKVLFNILHALQTISCKLQIFRQVFICTKNSSCILRHLVVCIISSNFEASMIWLRLMVTKALQQTSHFAIALIMCLSLFLLFFLYLHKVHKRGTKWVGRPRICESECHGTGCCRHKLSGSGNQFRAPLNSSWKKKIVYVIKYKLDSALKLHLKHFSVS